MKKFFLIIFLFPCFADAQWSDWRIYKKNHERLSSRKIDSLIVTSKFKIESGTPPTTPETGLINFQNGLLLLDSSTSVRDTIATREWAQSQFYSGTQTPTATNSTNVSASTPGQEQYMRVGNTVTVSGYIEIDCTSASVTSEIDLSLPIPSAFSNTTQLSGIIMEAVSGVASPGHGTISSNSTNDRVTIIFTPRLDTGLPYRYTYTYQVL